MTKRPRREEITDVQVMTYDHSAATGDEGVTAVALIVQRTLKWIFRTVSGPDRGIDAVVEQVSNREATARWISLQIKSGDGYFKEEGPEGIVFRDDDKGHLTYYRQHQLPVVIVLHHPGTDDAIWQWVTPDTVTETAMGWKLVVPHDQRLDASTAAIWARHLGRRIGPPPPRELHAETRVGDGSLATIHEVLGRAERFVLVSAPFLSVDLITLLHFVSSRLDVRILTSVTTFDQPLLTPGSPSERLEMRTIEGLHSKTIVVDGEIVCIASANLTRRGSGPAREVVTTMTTAPIVERSVEQFEDLWADAIALFPERGKGIG